MEIIRDKILDGEGMFTIACDHFAQWVQYRRSLEAFKNMNRPKRNWKTIVIVLWGRTGVGKSRFVHDQIQDSTFWSPGDYLWFDGYTGQDIVLFDDYRGEYKLQMLLKLCDRYPMSVPIKGGFTEWSPKKIYITSNINPCQWYKEADAFSLSAMFRRFSTIHACFDNIY